MSLFDSLANYNPSANNAVSEALAPTKTNYQLFKEAVASQGYLSDELNEFLDTNGNIACIACAGSGKTNGLSLKILGDYAKGELTVRQPLSDGSEAIVTSKVLVSTFSRGGAQELKTTFRRWQRRLNRPDISGDVRFRTLHAEFRAVLIELGVKVDIIPEEDNKALLRDVLSTLGYRLPYEKFQDFHQAITYTRSRLDEQRYDVPIYKEYNITPAIIDKIIESWRLERVKKGIGDNLSNAGYLDFEDIQTILYNWCYVEQNQTVIETLKRRYNQIYIDEGQDTSQIQYALVKIYAMGAYKVVIVGDDDQTIYSWRGSDVNIITKYFPTEFSANIVKLSTNYRCPSNILDPIIPSINRNTNRYPKPIKASTEGGSLLVGRYSNLSDMTSDLIKGIEEDVARGLSVAILTRQNVHGLTPAMLLANHPKGFSFSVSGYNMTFDSSAGSTILALVYLAEDRGSIHATRALTPLGFKASYQARMVSKEMRSSNRTLWDICSATRGLQELEYSVPKIYKHVRDLYLETMSLEGVAKAVGILEFYRDKVFVSKSNADSELRLMVDSVLSIIELRKPESLGALIALITGINESLKARKSSSLTAGVDIQISTVHDSKGKSFDSVYIWNDAKGIFPPSSAESDSEVLEEERRIHYIAGTRARQKLTILAPLGTPGKFFLEMDLSNAEEFSPQGIESVPSFSPSLVAPAPPSLPVESTDLGSYLTKGS